MTDRLGRADLHIHTLASDGTAGVVEILDHVERNTELDVIAITDHERIDAALAGRAIARDRGLRFEVVVGEEVTTLGGHLLALWIETPIKPFRSMRSTIAEIHDQGGLAIPAHPLVPYPLCAQGFVLRRLLADEPRYRPDAIEAFNPTTLGRPWHGRVVRFAERARSRPRRQLRRPRPRRRSGSATRRSRATTATALRAAIAAGTTHHHGTFHPTGSQLETFGAAAAQVRPRRAGEHRRPAAPRRDAARPRLPARR